MKEYLIGLLVIALLIEPYFFGLLIGMNMNDKVSVYFCSILIQLVTISFLILPYKIGKIFLK